MRPEQRDRVLPYIITGAVRMRLAILQAKWCARLLYLAGSDVLFVIRALICNGTVLIAS